MPMDLAVELYPKPVAQRVATPLVVVIPVPANARDDPSNHGVSGKRPFGSSLLDPR